MALLLLILSNVFLAFVTLSHIDALRAGLMGRIQCWAASRACHVTKRRELRFSKPHGSLPRLERAVQGVCKAHRLNCPHLGRSAEARSSRAI